MRAQPRATYRVQLRSEFDFDEAAGVVPYLAALGVSHLYCSPYMQAAPGSSHGYDVVDPTRVSEDLGGDSGLRRLDAALAADGMGQLLDIVPNHMCVSDPGNAWWWDVLRRGRSSDFAAYFDIDWDAPGACGRVVLPLLSDDVAALLQRGELQLCDTDAGVELHCGELRFPLREGSDCTGGLSQSLLDRQHYRLELWSSGLRHVNYRRFFDIASLAGLRQESSEVFDATHARALELVRDGLVDGLRVDHVDGLHDPAAYARRLRTAAPESWVVVEKIVSGDEHLPPEWPVDGTTGYDFCALVTSLMVDPAGARGVAAGYRRWTGDAAGFARHSVSARQDVLAASLCADVSRLQRVAAAAGVADCGAELRALLSGMPVYRVYPQQWQPLSETGAAAILAARSVALQTPDCDRIKLDALVDLLLGSGRDSDAGRELRCRFQQVAAAAMAKGVEDTAFYRYVPLTALNEVGCDPDRTTSIDEFHAECGRRAAGSQLALLATATHDTKRGEDARLRLAMLSEMPDAWLRALHSWSDLAAVHRGARDIPRAVEYLLMQTLVAAQPIDEERASAYMLKAAREAKQQTSWLQPDSAYEAGVDAYVRGVVGDAAIREQVEAFVAHMAPAWHTAALSQALLKLTCPGVPDIYQGCELWDLRLVDPDNRTPVDYVLRRRLLAELEGASAAEVMSRCAEGMPKLHVTLAALRLRARRPQAFAAGSAYQPLAVTGPRAIHAVAFARSAGDSADAVTLAVRLPHMLHGDWQGTAVELPQRPWRNLLTASLEEGGRRDVADLLRDFPVALLEAAA